ncbi:ferredoxin reductase family protein [Marmoricola sp. RAF53]|uniref:ferredoxin reductase family protein n=1 Tax=Marmoricola sp. RAF53 TaxID=3233059 RepID=UPI003F969335
MTALAPGAAVRLTSYRDRGRRARVDARVRLAAVAVLWLSLLLVTYWWVAGGGVQDLTTWTDGLDSVGRLSGLIASVLLLAQVVLMSRLPALERAYGQDRIAHLHRLVGFTSFNLMLLHIATITWGYAAGSLAATPGTFWNLTVSYPGMLLAVAGTACLVMVVVTSTRAARGKLRYESWHLLHLYAYLGVGLALPHQLWTGTDFTSSTGRTVFWWTAWAGTAALVLVTRVGRPLVLNLRHRLRVAAVVPEGDGIWSVHVTGRRLDRMRVEAGQFFTWRFLSGTGWSRGNPYSLSAAPDGRSLRITVQGVGDGSDATARLAPGTRVLVEGPYGRLSDRPRTRDKVAFIGAGVGITPLRALAEGLDYAPGDAVYLERCTDQPLFARELEALAPARGLRILRMPGRRRYDGSWLSRHAGGVTDTEALRYWVPDIAERDVYVCGPAPWTDLVRATLREAGLPDDQLHLESFSW